MPSPVAPTDSLSRLLRLLWQYRAQCLWVLCLQVLLLGASLCAVSLVGLCIDIMRHAVDVAAPRPRWPLDFEPPASWSARERLLLGAGLLSLMAIVHASLSYVDATQSGRLQHLRLVPELRSQALAKLMRLGFRYFDRTPSAAIVNRVTGDVQAVRSFVEGVLLEGTVLVVSLSAYVAFMLRVHVGLCIACLSFTPIIWLVTRRHGSWSQPAHRRVRQLTDDMVRTVAEGIRGIQVTKVFGREAAQLARFEECNNAIGDQQRAIYHRSSRSISLVQFAAQSTIAVLLIYGGLLVADDTLTLGQLVAFANVLSQFAAQVLGSARIGETFHQSLAATGRVFELLAEPEELSRTPQLESAPARTGLVMKGGVRFERVAFSYGGFAKVISDVSFDVPAGGYFAVFGATGSGKTTVLSLVARFYDATAGRVMIDGRDVRDFEPSGLRRSVGVVFQRTLLFKRSVAENIALGRSDASRTEIVQAARLAGAHEFIEKLPEGYDTVLAEGGADLSGGQRQRLALARVALLDAPIVVLDDPTTALDSLTAREVMAAMRRVMKGRTTLIATNRVAISRLADYVVVLEDGRVIEQGRPDALLGGFGAYHLAARLQETNPARFA